MSSYSTGIIIPAYNPDISTLTAYVKSIKDLISPSKIRIEIDSPKQKQIDRLGKTSADINISEERRGKGSAIMDGFDSLETDILAFADADGSVPASSLAEIIRQIEQGSTDVSIASRRHPSSQIISHQTIARRLLGDGFAFIARKMLPT